MRFAPRSKLRIDNQGGATPEVMLDFGGGPLGSAGGNCIIGAGVQNNVHRIHAERLVGRSRGPRRGHGCRERHHPDASSPLPAQPAAASEDAGPAPFGRMTLSLARAGLCT